MESRNKRAITLFSVLEGLANGGASDAKIAEAVREAFGLSSPKATPKKKSSRKKKAEE